jgi:alkylation response protein AidB-like acyl-CoA dehydrogenase
VLVPDDSSGAWRLGHVPLRTAVSELDLTRPSTRPVQGSAVTPVESRGVLDTDALSSWSALGLALTCADLVGVMRGAVELARAYAVERRQYDVPIGSFQAVQHLLADAFVSMEGSRSVTLHAAWAVDALPPGDALAAGALAKAYCSRGARRVCEISVQVHGGMGNTWDCLAHVFLRRALLSSELFGGTDTNVGRVLEHHGIATAVRSGHGLR